MQKKNFLLKKVECVFPILWCSLRDLQGDVIAGLTVGLTVIPQGLAYAQVASLPHQVTMETAISMSLFW